MTIYGAVSFRTRQISWAEYEANIEEFGKLVELPVEPKAFISPCRELVARHNSKDGSFNLSRFNQRDCF